MARKFFSQPDGTDIEPYPFDGALDEHTAAEMLTLLGALGEVVIYDDDTEVTGTFNGINFKSGAGILATVADSPLDAGDTVDVTYNSFMSLEVV